MKKDTRVIKEKSAIQPAVSKSKELFKNHLTKIIFQIGKYKGKDRLDIRTWVCVDEDTQKFIPTKAGVNIELSQLEELKEIVNSF
jgi:hypothetical protein